MQCLSHFGSHQPSLNSTSSVIIRDQEGNLLLKIHGQQIDNRDGTFSYANYTKNEKGNSQSGRLFPVTATLETILKELKGKLEERNIVSEYIFVNSFGNWIPVKDYLKMLNKICTKLGLKSKGSYAFRRSVNAALDEAGFSSTTRAALLGHLAETNVFHYTHPRNDVAELGRSALESKKTS